MNLEEDLGKGKNNVVHVHVSYLLHGFGERKEQ
jgi:hypothetical protein